MLHEIKKLIASYHDAANAGVKTVLATVVALEGSSYRRPGVRMLIWENGKMTGAVSGGCVEKDVFRQSTSVFKTGMPKVMTYDGRYRLGCEGILYILIEPFTPSPQLLEAFQEELDKRDSIQVTSTFTRNDAENQGFGTVFTLGGLPFYLQGKEPETVGTELFSQQLEPCFKLVILGAEHDTVQLCTFASLMGWEVTVVVPPSEEKNASDFPGVHEFVQTMPDQYMPKDIDAQTAVMLMSHSYVKDLQHLIALKDTKPAYLGLLGPSKRREKLLNEFLERCPDVDFAFMDRIHGPAGLHIGAETPQEIVISVLAEVLSVIRNTEPKMLKNKKGPIHV